MFFLMDQFSHLAVQKETVQSIAFSGDIVTTQLPLQEFPIFGYRKYDLKIRQISGDYLFWRYSCYPLAIKHGNRQFDEFPSDKQLPWKDDTVANQMGHGFAM